MTLICQLCSWAARVLTTKPIVGGCNAYSDFSNAPDEMGKAAVLCFGLCSGKLDCSSSVVFGPPPQTLNQIPLSSQD